ncbi:Gfo/Idh/MocA family oxidoreductase [Micromonospora sp. NBC_00421]|uniref:Gfo/Idh/MocA family oxidoreductase n=1 Tax=Micromonospora sp. NBC_00421 TaxID=2975976 RepID=UPI002E23D347
MRIAIIGVGHIGRRYAGYLREDGLETVFVDNNGRFDHRRVAEVTNPGAVDVWIVATPTATHLGVVREILELVPAAAVLIEKPACHPDQIPALASMFARHPDARLLVNDVYQHSATLHTLAAATHVRAPHDPVRRITVEFSKNRLKDVADGRFVDQAYGDVGYEWFHMLSLLRALLPTADFKQYLSLPLAVATPEVHTEITLPAGVDITLHSSVVGHIGFPEIGLPFYAAAVPQRHLGSGEIPYGSDFRYRVAVVDFQSGGTATAIFEPHYGRSVDFKNQHLVEVRADGRTERHDITDNHLRRALGRQIRDITTRDPCDDGRLRLDEHRHMADLAGVLRRTDDRRSLNIA